MSALADTLAERLDRDSMPEPNSGCYLWLNSPDTNGYGRIVFRRRRLTAHRAAWIAAFGEVPDDLQVLHRCDNRACVNPGHLWLGTPKANMADKCAKDRQPRGERRSDCKLSDDDVRAVRADRRIRRIIAQEYGVSKTLITEIKTGKRRWFVLDLPAAPLFVGVPTPERETPTMPVERAAA